MYLCDSNEHDDNNQVIIRTTPCTALKLTSNH